jgi:hypothetical protein
MSHNKHVIDNINKDLIEYTREKYLDITKDWIDPYGLPHVEKHDGVSVVRDDHMVGSKCRFADLLVSSMQSDTIVYVQPRFGLAGPSILEVAKRYNKKVVLFMPSSKKISQHQAVCIERGAIAKFYRIAAMPVLNGIAKKWADDHGAAFVPLGLKHPLVTACAVRVAQNLTDVYGEPGKVWCAISTGVLSRALQIGWPTAEHNVIAVARNMKAGELGSANVFSERKAFAAAEEKENFPPFPTVGNYDAKVWKYIDKKNALYDNTWMWNVGKEPVLFDQDVYNKVDSYRNWGEIR